MFDDETGTVAADQQKLSCYYLSLQYPPGKSGKPPKSASSIPPTNLFPASTTLHVNGVVACVVEDTLCQRINSGPRTLCEISIMHPGVGAGVT